MACVKAGGSVLIIETTDAMTLSGAWRWLRQAGRVRRNWLVLLAAARRRRRAVNADDLALPGCRLERTDLLGGLVAAWICITPGRRCSA